MTMVIIAMIYLSVSIIFNFIYIPLSNPLECFSILKSHADLLTILFCIGVIGSAANSLDPITTGIMSGILMLIIVYKGFKGMTTPIKLGQVAIAQTVNLIIQDELHLISGPLGTITGVFEAAFDTMLSHHQHKPK